MKYIPDIITSVRIIGSIIMIFTPTLSKEFYVVYTIAGISDVLDGYVARKTKTTSEFGKKLDSFADLLFYTTMMIKVMPYLLKLLPKIIWVFIYVALAIRVVLYGYFGVFKHTFISNHTYGNKLTGFSLFFLPYMLSTKVFIPYAYITSLIALFATFYEAILLIKKK